MSILHEDIRKPQIEPSCSPQEILNGPAIKPEDRIKLYSDGEFEDFIKEWAYFYLQNIGGEYEKVARFGGSGDLGRDVVGYVNYEAKICDVYQCKHYGHPIQPGEIWIEFAKLCYYTHRDDIPVPRHYYIIAPQDVGGKLGGLLENPSDLRRGLVEEWSKIQKPDFLGKKLIKGKSIVLTGDLKQHVESFDFSKVRNKPIIEIVNEFRSTNRHAMRFGGGLTKPLPTPSLPPAAIATHETRYVNQLITAYHDHTSDQSFDQATLQLRCDLTELAGHFNRSRERFYCAESIREFAKDNLPEPFTFLQVQDQIHDGVIDTADSAHDSGYKRLLATTQIAGSLQLANHPLATYVDVKSKHGICHQLANDDRLTWCK